MRSQAVVVSLVAILMAGLLASPARAGGLYLSTFATPDMGTATAGAGSLANDASTALLNPAGMTRLEEHELLVGVAPGGSEIEFRQSDNTPTPGTNGGNQGGFVPIASGQYVHKLSERLRLGLSLFSVSGAVLDPRDNWTGRNEVTEIDLFSITIQPSLAIRVTDWLSIGGGAAITYGTLDLEVRAPALNEPTVKLKDADAWGAAPVASALIEVTPELRLGVAYLGETKLKLDGKLDLPAFLPTSFIDLDLDFAQAIRGSGTWQATEKLTLLLSGGWEDWSVLDRIPITFGPVGTGLPLHFRDTWNLAGGIRYRKDPWTWQLGVRYDSSPVKDKNRLAALPLDRVWTVGVGTLHQWSEHLRIGFAFNWLDLGRARLETGSVRGRYQNNNLYLFNVSIQMRDLPWAGKLTF